jgi:hypothetical protein
MPVHHSRAGVLTNDDSEIRRLVTDQAVLMPTTLELPSLADLKAKPFELASGLPVPLEPDQQRQVRLAHRAKVHVTMHPASVSRRFETRRTPSSWAIGDRNRRVAGVGNGALTVGTL